MIKLLHEDVGKNPSANRQRTFAERNKKKSECNAGRDGKAFPVEQKIRKLKKRFI